MHSLIWLSLYAIFYANYSLAAPATTPSAILSQIASHSSAEAYAASISSRSVASLITASPKPPSFRDIIGEMNKDLPAFYTNAAHTTPNQTFSIPNVTASLPPATTVAPLNRFDYAFHPHRQINYSVPHSLTNLSIILANPGQVPSIDPQAMAKTILSLQSTLQTRINATGDRWLNDKEDPLGWEIGLGCWLEFWSNPEKGPEGKEQHLTLGILKAALGGLLDRLVYKGLYDFAYVEIYDSQWGLTGMGFASPDEGPSNKTDKLFNVLNTLRIEGKR